MRGNEKSWYKIWLENLDIMDHMRYLGSIWEENNTIVFRDIVRWARNVAGEVCPKF
jgi:hypothetical protein